jgi:predicted small lipoprotein YifL
MKFVLLTVLIALSLAGCGRRGAPSPPGPASAVTYPQSYPSE